MKIFQYALFRPIMNPLSFRVTANMSMITDRIEDKQSKKQQE